MIQLFDVQDKRVVPSAITHLIPELQTIIDTFPDEYLKVLAYVFFTTCPDGTNPYVNLPENEKEDIILLDLQPFEFYVEDMKIEVAKAKCKKLYETPTLRGYLGAKVALDRVGDYLATTEITDGKEGSAMTIDRYMSKLSDYTDTYTNMENKLKEEQSKVRGDIRVPHHQRAGYKEKEDNIDE